MSPSRVQDTRIPANGRSTFAVPQVPDDAVAVLVNVTGANPDGPTTLSLPALGEPTVNLRAGETRANLAVVPIGNHSLTVAAGPNAVEAVIDLAGYYSANGTAKYTPLNPQRVMDATPVGPDGTITLDLSAQVPAGATAVTFNLTAANATASSAVTAYAAGQPKPSTANLTATPGEDTPNLVTVGLSADRKVTLANAAGTVDLSADLAGYYSPQSTQAFYPVSQLRVLDTRSWDGKPRDPITEGAEHRLDLSGWLPAGATAAVVNLTATNVSVATYVSAHPADQQRPSARTISATPGRTVENLAVIAVSADRALDLYNFHGQVDVLAEIAGYFAPARTACQRGCVYGFGTNSDGQAGNGTVGGITAAAAVYGLDSVVAVSDYGPTRYAVRSDGSVWAWGWSAKGALGAGPVGSGDVQGSPTYRSYAPFPVKIPGLSNIVAVSAQVALRADGTVWVWGQNAYKHLGPGFPHGQYDTPVQVTELNHVVAIAGDLDHTYAVKADGTVWSWGWNKAGELGNGTIGTDCESKAGDGDQQPNCAAGIPVRVKGLGNVTKIAPGLAVRSDGSLWQWGPRDTDRQDNAPVRVPGVSNARAVAAGGSNYVLRADGTVWAWGFGWNGSLGDGTEHTSYVDSPVKVKNLAGVRAIGAGVLSGYAVTSDGKEYAWGGGQDGLLGDGNERAKSLVPVPVPGVSGATGLGSNGYAIA
ncbi:RCC1 domain-containing protein [Kutzneria chonburiensis]|uniref:RCC1 domain-containing protein n=1 Tax=Kutzneria chonburiensis TaxID=1483604 RepID=UPI0036D345B0